MAGSRMIRKGFVDSDRVSSLASWFDECVYHRLLLVADDYGLFDARPAYVRAQLFSTKLDKVREADVQRALLECERAGLIRFYEVDGKRYLEVLRYGQRAGRTQPKYPLPADFSGSLPQSAAICRRLPHSAALDGDGDGDVYGDGDVRASHTTGVALDRTRPLPDEVLPVMAALNLAPLQGEAISECVTRFIDEMEASGWCDRRGVPLHDWRPAARNWARRYAERLGKHVTKDSTMKRKDCNDPSRYR